MPRAPWPRSNTFAVTLALAACLACAALACSAPLLLAASGSPAAQAAQAAGFDVVPLCAWARNGRAGLWWNSAITPRAPITHSGRFNAVCVAAPWPTFLPARGRPSFDFRP